MKTLIIGGDGYIGSNLVPRLEKPVIYDIKRGLDIRDPQTLEDFVEEVDAVIHLAAIASIAECEEDPTLAYETNLKGTQNVVDACLRHGIKLVFAGSRSVHRPSVYGATKLLGERLVLQAGGVVNRLANVWGGLRFLELKNSAVAGLNKGTFEERGHGKEIRDFIHVDQVCDEFVESLTRPSGIYEVCTGNEISIDELCRRFGDGEFRVSKG